MRPRPGLQSNGAAPERIIKPSSLHSSLVSNTTYTHLQYIRIVVELTTTEADYKAALKDTTKEAVPKMSAKKTVHKDNAKEDAPKNSAKGTAKETAPRGMAKEHAKKIAK